MPKIVRAALVAGVCALTLAGCQLEETAAETRSSNQKAVDACIAQDGVPILSDTTGFLSDCKFPPEATR